MGMRPLESIFLTLILLGAINWGLVGVFQYDLVAGLLGGSASAVSRVIYTLVGIAGIYCLTLYGRIDGQREVE